HLFIITLPPPPHSTLFPYTTLFRSRHDRGRYFSIIVVAEGAKLANRTPDTERRKTDEFGHVRLGGIGNTLAAELEARTGFETRRSEEHTSELQSPCNLVCRLLLEKK